MKKDKPKIVKITHWQKLGDREYRIGYDSDLDSMGNYHLVRKEFSD